MPSRLGFIPRQPVNPGLTVLLATLDSMLQLDLERTFHAMGLRVETAGSSETAIAAVPMLEEPAVLLLDTRMTSVGSGRLLAAIEDLGAHKRFPIALIAEAISEEWMMRLREGVVDDIVPRKADSAAWATHLSTMRRGHQLARDLDELREASLVAVQHDRVTGAFHRGTMVTLLFRETDRVQRLHGSLSLVLFAIDDFAYWTSDLGRDGCDRLLREVAVRTGRMLRSYDLLGRTGEDEFLLGLPGCSTINAVAMAERMRTEVFGEPFAVWDGNHKPLQVRLTACFGVASSRGRSPVVVLREAEQTLALCRRSGPDAIRCAGESPLQAEDADGFASLFPDSRVMA
jgi:diguanylate cyclase (GGDEF)-like protein